MSRLKFALLLLFAAILLPRIYSFIKLLDFGETVINHSPGPCEQVKGIDIGSEDIDLVPGTDIALISTGLRYGTISGIEDRQGNIMYFNFAKPNEGAKTVTFKSFSKSDSFNPHGISIIKLNGKVYLMVVNHPSKDVSSIERFEVDVKTFTLTHLETITDQHFRYMNDVSATGEREFYFTNHMYYEPGSVMGTIESLGQLRFGSLCYYDGKKTVTVDTNMFGPNGVHQSPDRKYLYVVNGLDKSIRTYEIHEDKNLTLVQTKEVDTLPDNISVDPDSGDLWIGCHPVGWQIVHYLDHQATATAPSQVLKIRTENGLLTDDVKEVYVDKGSVISASTVALYHKNSFLIGSVSHKAVYCQVKFI